MARIRTIKPDFWTNEKVMECAPLTRLLFIGMWNFADDYGRLPFSPKSIKAQVFAADDIDGEAVRRMLVELSSNGLVMIYAVDGREYIEITGWDHQRIDRKGPSKYPAPFVEPSSNDRRALAPDLTVSNGKGSEAPRDELKIRTGNFQQAIVKAFAEGNSPNLPVTSRAGLWLTQGYQEDICLAVIAELVRKKPSITTLNYFDNAIKEAHASKAPARTAVPMKPEEVNWDQVLTDFKKFGRWSRWAGPDLESPACRAPLEMLEKHGLAKLDHDPPPGPMLRAMQ